MLDGERTANCDKVATWLDIEYAKNFQSETWKLLHSFTKELQAQKDSG